MDNKFCGDNEIIFICKEIDRLFEIDKLIVFGVKRNEKNNSVTDVDICVVCEYGDKNAWLKKAYLEIESKVPYDIFLYTPSEWDEMTKQSESFASRIVRKGCVVIG